MAQLIVSIRELEPQSNAFLSNIYTILDKTNISELVLSPCNIIGATTNTFLLLGFRSKVRKRLFTDIERGVGTEPIVISDIIDLLPIIPSYRNFAARNRLNDAWSTSTLTCLPQFGSF